MLYYEYVFNRFKRLNLVETYKGEDFTLDLIDTAISLADSSQCRLFHLFYRLFQILDLRKAADIGCDGNISGDGPTCRPLLAPCLFNIHDDPCEKHNLADR